jgi:hypothetical protein
VALVAGHGRTHLLNLALPPLGMVVLQSGRKTAPAIPAWRARNTLAGAGHTCSAPVRIITMFGTVVVT